MMSHPFLPSKSAAVQRKKRLMPYRPRSDLAVTFTDPDHSMLSDDDEAPIIVRRFASAQRQSIPWTARGEPTTTSTTASSPQLPLTSDMTITATSTPASAAHEEVPPTPEQILQQHLAAAKQDARSEREEKLRIRRARTGERKPIAVLKAERRELNGRPRVQDAALKEKDVGIALEQDRRAALSREHDRLARKLDAAKKRVASAGRASAQQGNEKDREIQELRGERARKKAGLDERHREIEDLQRRLAREVRAYTRKIETLKAQCANEQAGLGEKTREIDELKAELAEKQGTAAGNPMLQILLLELQKTQASLMMPAAPPKTAERGVETGTQTDDDGLAEKVAAMKRMLG